VLNVFQATRYVVPLREGGSLPAVVDTDDGGLFVAKFRGAGQGAKSLVAEILVARIARALALPVPEIALIELDESFGRTEPDPEIQDILKGSRGTNVGMRYLEGAFNFDPNADRVAPELAAGIVWLDALVENIDRTAKNPNLMWQDESLWLIDHGAALYFHHNWRTVDRDKPKRPFERIGDHVLLPVAGDLRDADARLSALLGPSQLREIVECLPDELLMDAPAGVAPPFASADDNRDAYASYLEARLESPRPFAAEAARVQQQRRERPKDHRKGYRR
jgi:hypothetical protein